MRYVYQSPKSKMRSSPVDESEKGRIAILVASGWSIVETLDAAPVVVVERPAKALPDAELPEDVPNRDLLIDAGLDTLDKVKAALPDLHTFVGFGPSRSAAVRAYFQPPEV